MVRDVRIVLAALFHSSLAYRYGSVPWLRFPVEARKIQGCLPGWPRFYKINGLLQSILSRKQVPADHKAEEHHL
jgi:hypothetical protein